MTPEVRHECYKCSEELVFDVKIGRLDTCPNCAAYLHSCRNCRFWSPSAHNQCLENQGEFVRDREAGNFCGHFQFRVIGEELNDEAAKAKAKLAGLFGSKGGAAAGASPLGGGDKDGERAALSRLDALFKKK